MSGLNAANVMIPGRGAIFTAAPGTPAPDYKLLDPANPPAGWECLGHTSKENSVALGKSGGEATSYGSWWAEALAVTYDATSWDISVGALQVDAGVLDLAFNGSIDNDGGYIVPSEVVAVDKAIFVLAVQGSKRMGLYLPKVSVTLGDAPTFDPTKLFEVPLKGTVLSSENGLMKWYHPGLETAVALVVSSASPADSAPGGTTVTITGTGFVGATGVNFGAVAAANPTFVSDTEIQAVVPNGGNASVPITVKKNGETSNALPYQRTAAA